MRITDKARKQMAVHIAQFIGSGEDGSVGPEKFVDDIRVSYELIVENPSVGDPAESSVYPNARMVGLASFDSFLIIFNKDDEGIVIVGLILSWRTGL